MEYEELRKEHPILPDKEELKEYEIDYEQKNILKEILKKISERYEPILETLEHIISPDPSNFTDMYECRTFTQGEKKQIFEIFKQLMTNYRMLLEADLSDEKTQTETIKKTNETWKTLKKQVIPHIKKLKEAWQKQIEVNEILDYLG